MKERPIPFSAPMVRALLAGTKTQTRRVVKPRKDRDLGCELSTGELAAEANAGNYRNAYCAPGDRLWVREAWQAELRWDWTPPRDINPGSPIYFEFGDEAVPACAGKRRPGMFMPRWASRITLEVTGVRVERLQDISEADAIAEGIERSGECNWRDYGDDGNDFTSARRSYRSLWDSINDPSPCWGANPWVWVVEFRKLQPAEYEPSAAAVAAERERAESEPLRCDGCGKTIAEHDRLLHCPAG